MSEYDEGYDAGQAALENLVSKDRLRTLFDEAFDEGRLDAVAFIEKF